MEENAKKAYAEFQNKQLLPGEAQFRNRDGLAPDDTLPLDSDSEFSDYDYDDDMGQPAAYQAQGAPAYQAPSYQAPSYQAPAYQAPKSLEELRERQNMFTDLERNFALKRMQLDRGSITQDEFNKQVEIFERQAASLKLTKSQMDKAGLFLLNKQGGKRKSHYSKTNKMRRSRSNKRSKSRSNKRSKSRSNKRYRSRK